MPPDTTWPDAADFLAAHPATRFIDVLLADLCGIPRGKRLAVDEVDKLPRGGFLLPGSMFALDVLGGTIQATGLGFDEGDADRACLPVPGTLLPVPWIADGSVAQVQVSMRDHDGGPFYGDPRHVLAGVLERFAARGLQPVVAIELEFYLVDRERTREGALQPPHLPISGRREFRTQINSMADLGEFSGVLSDIAAAARLQDLPTGTALAEYGPGQLEVNLHHSDDPLAACDQAIRLKRLVKAVALTHAMEATFMPKPYATMAGSGAHVHVSLLDRNRENVFASEETLGNATLRHATGGLARSMADAMLLFAPVANSYRRFQPEAYVPLRPTWGYNNRGVALRIPVSDAANRRIEHRVAGADANPYLLVAVVLAGILEGLERKLDPGPPVTGNAYGDPTIELPTNWPEAVRAFEHSAFLREYLGEAFVRLYATTRRGELEAFESHVTPREIDWYATTC
jgi:glutamine synthetase